MTEEYAVGDYTECEIPLFDSARTYVCFAELIACIKSLTMEQLLRIHFWLGQQPFITCEHEYTKLIETEIQQRTVSYPSVLIANKDCEEMETPLHNEIEDLGLV